MVGFSDSMSIIRYDSIRDYHVMNVRDLVFVMAAAEGIYRRYQAGTCHYLAPAYVYLS